jgi:hypothetical protein
LTPEEEEEARALVEKAARAAGYDSPILYHGGIKADEIKEFSDDYQGDTTGNNDSGAFHFIDEEEVADDYSRQSFIRRYQDNPEGLVEDGFISQDEFDRLEAEEVEWYGHVDELAEENISTANVYLKIKNPITLDGEHQRADIEHLTKLRKFVKRGEDETGEILDSYMDQIYGEFDSDLISENKAEIKEYASEYFGADPSDIDPATFDQAANEYLSENGYARDETPIDGIIYKNMIDDISPQSTIVGDQYIAFEPSQIKSAELFTGTPLSERFDSESDLIDAAFNPAQRRAADGRWEDEGGPTQIPAQPPEMPYYDRNMSEDERVKFRADMKIYEDGFTKWAESLSDDKPLIWADGNKAAKLLTPTNSDEDGNKWRVTRFDEWGPSSHIEGETKREVLSKSIPRNVEFLEDFPDLRKIDAAFNPAQKRAQKGQGNGGQWVKDGGVMLTPQTSKEVGRAVREVADDWDNKGNNVYEGKWAFDPEKLQNNWERNSPSFSRVMKEEDEAFYEKLKEAIKENDKTDFSKFYSDGPRAVLLVDKGMSLSDFDFSKNESAMARAQGFVIRLNHRQKGWLGEVERPKPKNGTVGSDLGSVLRHEYGHLFWNNAMTKQDRGEFLERVKDPNIISKYAGALSQEVFPETLALVTHPKYDEGDYPEWVGELGDWMKTELTK